MGHIFCKTDDVFVTFLWISLDLNSVCVLYGDSSFINREQRKIDLKTWLFEQAYA